MLPKSNEKEDKQFIIPPKTKLLYEDFKLVAETSTYRAFNARARASREWHTVRVLDCTKEYAKANNDHAATLFVQELLWLQQSYPGSVFTNTFEISGNGNQMACATLSYLPLSCQLSGTEEVINPKDSKVIEKLLSDVLRDVEFLWKDLHLRKILDALAPENISFIKEKGRFFLGNWAKIYEKAQSESSNLSALAEGFPDSDKLRALIGKMLSPDLHHLPNLEELMVKEERTQHSFKLVDEESKQLQGKTQGVSPNKQSTIIGIHTLYIYHFSS